MPENKPNIADIDGDRLVWGAKDIGAVINRDQRPTFYLLEAGRIEGARKIGSRCCASPEFAQNGHRSAITTIAEIRRANAALYPAPTSET